MRKAIVVDDENYVLELFEEIIDWSLYGFEIVGLFDSVDSAFAFLESNEVDVIFTDISMNDKDGFVLAEKCINMYKKTKIIFFSAYDSFEYAQKAFSFGVFDYLLKPLSYASLIKTLERLQNYYMEYTPDGSISTDEFVTDVIKYIEANYSKEITLESISKHKNFSPTYFSALYKQKSGKSFSQTLCEIRIKHAKEFLKNPTIKISAIPEMVGFQSRSYFVKTFKKYEKISPSEYRSQKKKQL